MTTHDAMLKDLLIAAFLHKGGEESHSVQVFDALGDDAKAALASLANLAPAELTILGSYTDNDNWLLLTANRLAWCCEGDACEIAALAIMWAYNEIGEKHTKTEGAGLCTLNVCDLEKTEHQLRVESGHAAIGLMNCLMRLGRINEGRLKKQ